MHPLVECQVFRSGQRHTGGGDSFHGRIVCQVDEQNGTVDGAGAAEFFHEVFRFFKGDADGGKDDGEVGRTPVQNLCLTGDLGGQLVMGQAGAGEDGQLLTTNQGVQAVNGGDARLDEFVGVVTGGGVHSQTVDVPMGFRQDGGAIVDGVAHAGKDTTEHIAGDCQLQGTPQEADFGAAQVDAGRRLKELHDSLIAVDFQNLPPAELAVGQFDLTQFVIGDAGDPANHHQRAGDFFDGTIFFDHQSSSPFSAIAVICASMSAASLE